MNESLTKRGFGRVGKPQKRARGSAESAASKGEGLELFIAPLGKTSHFIAVAITDTSGMTYTAPTVTELQ